MSPRDQLQLDSMVALCSNEWNPTTASRLWDLGLDFGEDERNGRRLEILVLADGVRVRTTWAEDGKLIVRMYVNTEPSRTLTVESEEVS